jgi:hypothetical protein
VAYVNLFNKEILPTQSISEKIRKVIDMYRINLYLTWRRDGTYPEGTVNCLVNMQLGEFAEKLMDFGVSEG